MLNSLYRVKGRIILLAFKGIFHSRAAKGFLDTEFPRYHLVLEGNNLLNIMNQDSNLVEIKV